VLGLEQPHTCHPWCCLGQHIEMNQAKVTDEPEHHKDARLILGLVGMLVVDSDISRCEDKVPVVRCYALRLLVYNNAPRGGRLNFIQSVFCSRGGGRRNLPREPSIGATETWALSC
jgi:hypothetical protein